MDPKNPPLVWEVWNGEAWLTAQVTEDTTGGLNRAGEIVLLIPIEHELMTIGNTAAYWLRARLLAPQQGQPTYQASPRMRSVVAATLGGTVRAEHAENVPPEILGRSDGGAGQAFTVSRVPVLPRRDGEHVVVTDSDGAQGWVEVEDFTASEPEDRHYIWDSGSGIIRFGPRVRYPDGSVRQHGAIPRDSAQVCVTRYRHGGGTQGQRRCPHPHRHALHRPLRPRRDQPLAGHRRGGRGDDRRGEDPRVR